MFLPITRRCKANPKRNRGITWDAVKTAIYAKIMACILNVWLSFFIAKDPKESPDYARIVNNRHFK